MSKKKNTATAPAAPTAPAPETAAPETAAPAPEHGSVVVPVLRKQATRALWAALGTNPGSTAAALADTAGIAVSTARRLLTGWESARAVRSYTDPETPRAAKTWFTAGSAAPEPSTPVAAEPEPATPEPVAPAPAAPESVNPPPGPAAPAAPETLTPEPDSAESDSAEPAAPEPVSLEPTTPDQTDPAEEAASADPAPDNVPETAAAAPTGDDPATPAPVAPAPPAEPAAADAESTAERLPAGALRGQVEDYLRDNPGKELSPHQIGKALERSSGAVHNALVKLAKDGTARQTSTAPKKFTLAS
ncbi:hypothetical protein [Nocardia fluminea]|uniref:Ribonuclease E n=1 Tax=Nocardia fluminea TaxID=134984 RepID=A0A2N3WYI3_9NOCA|nr:hypothetical protein [Nocardia fluminea]PKV98927.1 ribonuclease E [Nocardia fluminea]